MTVEKTWRLSLHQGLVLIDFPPDTLIDAATMKSIYYELNSDPGKYRTTNIVWDFRNVLPTGDIGYEHMFELVDHFKSLRQAWWRHDKTALVAGSKAAYGLCRMFASLAEGKMDYQVQIFDDDLEAAMAWARPAE